MSLVIDRLNEHYSYATKDYNKDNIVGLFLVGSQNYGTDTEKSDVDTKLLVVPTLDDIYKNYKGESKTIKIQDLNEFVTVKDIRCAFKEFQKQGNLLEILFTDYCIINSPYKKYWQILIDKRELIARYDPYLVVKAAKGIALNSYERLYSKDGVLSAKQVANLVRIEYFIKSYIDKHPYAECIKPTGDMHDYIMQIRNREIGESTILTIAENAVNTINLLTDTFCNREDLIRGNPEVEELLQEVTKEMIDTAFIMEYVKNGEL